ncbi:MAG: hypothetical protein R3350_01485 [Saprospiraceae bacterium]|nr:hypothetical protein [Saprospiraceae bacterium]
MRIFFSVILALVFVNHPIAQERSQRTDDGLRYANYDYDCRETIGLPEPTGPYPAGTVTYHWADSSRMESLSKNPHDYRQLIVQVFYPAVINEGVVPVSYVPEIHLLRAGFTSDSREVPRQIADDLASMQCVRTHSFSHIRMSRTEERYPIVLFSPGGNMSRHWHTSLAQELASHGYVTVVMSHAYSGMDIFPEGGLLMSSQYWQGPENASEARKKQLENELTEMLAADARFALNNLLYLNDHQPESFLYGKLDASRVAILGHSRGGSTVARFGSIDNRVRACVVYDNIGPDKEVNKGLSQPQLVIRRTWSRERTARYYPFLEKNDAIAYDMVIEGASHFSFSDLPIVDPVNYPSDIEPRRAHDLFSGSTRSFLDVYLKGDGEAADLIKAAAANEEVSLRVFE